MVKSCKKPKVLGKTVGIKNNGNKSMVANVNKSPRVHTRSRSKVVEPIAPANEAEIQGKIGVVSTGKKRTSNNVVFDEIANPPIPSKRKVSDAESKKSLTGPVSKQRKQSSATKKKATNVQATFLEEDNLMRMSVESGDETMFNTESSDNESETRANKNDQFEQTDSSSDSSESSDSDMSGSEDSQSDEELGASLSDQQMNNREKINKIDQEMVTKMQELEQLMLNEGLTESARVLERCLKATTNKPVGEATPSPGHSPH